MQSALGGLHKIVFTTPSNNAQGNQFFLMQRNLLFTFMPFSRCYYPEKITLDWRFKFDQFMHSLRIKPMTLASQAQLHWCLRKWLS